MTLRIQITNGEVLTWEYRAPPPPAPDVPLPTYREPIVLQREAGPLPTLVTLALFAACAIAWGAIIGSQ